MILALAMIQCSRPAPHSVGPTAYVDSDYGALTVTPLKGRILADSGVVGREGGICLIADRIVTYGFTTPTLKVLDSRTGRLVGKFGRIGAGQGEFRGPWGIATASNDPEDLWVFDVDLHRVTKIHLPREESKITASPFIDLVSDAALLAAMPIGDTLIATMGTFNSGRFGYFDRFGHLVSIVGNVPEGPDSIPVTVRQNAYEARMRSDPTGHLFAVATLYAGDISIYTSAGELVSRAHTPFHFAPRFVTRMRRGYPSFAQLNDIRFGYLDLAATRRHIYALFSGRTRNGFGANAPYGQYVHVFDWQGNLEMILKLQGIDAAGIAVDDHDSELIALRHSPTPALLTFPLRTALRLDTAGRQMVSQ